MPSTDDIRRTLTNPTPLYFAAGVLDKIRSEAPERIAAVRATDPKEVQARFTKQAKEAQAKVTETLGGLDTDLKKLREQAQHLALQGLGVAAEYAVKAREGYDELANRGRVAVRQWRGEDSGEAPEVTVEREPVKVAEPPAGTETPTAGGAASASTSSAARRTTTARTTTAKSTTARTSTARNTTAKGTTGKTAGTGGDATGNGTAKSGPARNGTAKPDAARKTTPKSDS